MRASFDIMISDERATTFKESSVDDVDGEEQTVASAPLPFLISTKSSKAVGSTLIGSGNKVVSDSTSLT